MKSHRGAKRSFEEEVQQFLQKGGTFEKGLEVSPPSSQVDKSVVLRKDDVRAKSPKTVRLNAPGPSGAPNQVVMGASGMVPMGVSPSEAGKHHRQKSITMTQCDGAAIIAVTEATDLITDKIYFSMGLGNDKHIQVSKDGSKFIFNKEGFYNIKLTGSIIMIGRGQVTFKRTPDIDEDKRAFSVFKIDKPDVSISTMLPIKEGHTLEVIISKNTPGSITVEKGMQLEIHRVDSTQ